MLDHARIGLREFMIKDLEGEVLLDKKRSQATTNLLCKFCTSPSNSLIARTFNAKQRDDPHGSSLCFGKSLSCERLLRFFGRCFSLCTDGDLRKICLNTKKLLRKVF